MGMRLGGGTTANVKTVVLISADAEWAIVRETWVQANLQASPFGEWFTVDLSSTNVLFFNGGWGKIAAAASTQYVIGRWAPELLVNLGTCGGFEGAIARGTILLAERTLVYDIVEQMGDYDEAMAHYATALDTSWWDDRGSGQVQRGLLISADRDILPADIPALRTRYGAVAADWESGAIAWVAARNGTRCLIFRGVTDLVGSDGGEAYGNIEVFRAGTRAVMKQLLQALPQWIA